jgi:hypothetical protein
MVRVFVFLAAVELVLVVLALISCLSAERARIRGLPRAAWLLVILLLPLLGPAVWFLAGRPKPDRPDSGGARRRGPRPSSPDDDPDFLRNLDADQSRRDRELFEQWEADLRRREEQQRRRDNGEKPPTEAG